MKNTYNAVALFSGGLDSILAVKVIEEQGLSVKCLHFSSPFFGKELLLDKWSKVYNIDIECVDISNDFINILLARPEHGFGKLLNPCVDCKILLMRKALEFMKAYNASFIISGEVLGQRPMSQRRDTLNVICREGGVQGLLVRPLSAKLLNPSLAEQHGIVNRELLHDISGRGRKQQLQLASNYGIQNIPTPAGGCMLAEQENASRYWMVLTRLKEPQVEDFILAHTGRQFWNNQGRGEYWLSVGRDASSNAALHSLVDENDYVFHLRDFAGPLALGRYTVNWNVDVLQDAASFVASYAPKAVQSGCPVVVMWRRGHRGKEEELLVFPNRKTQMQWQEPNWTDAKHAKQQELKDKILK